MSDVTIHRVTVDHVDTIYDMICELQKETLDKEKFFRIFNKNIGLDDIIYRMAMLDNQPVGFASLHIQGLLHHGGRVGEIQEIFVNPEYQGNGIGKALIENIINEAKTHGCMQVEVCCNMKNTDAVAFYEKLKFNKTHFKLVISL